MSSHSAAALHAGERIATGPRGEVANAALIAHTRHLEKRLYQSGPSIWTAVGHGMSNAILIDAPEGMLVVDTGEGLEEAQEHIDAFAGALTKPVRAVLYSHSHYAHGTPSWQARQKEPLEVWGHASMARIMTDTATEVGPAYARRARVQFSYYLPEDGPDAMPNQGIGLTFFHRDRPTTRRHVPPDHSVHEECTVRIAGTTVHFVPAPSDSDDTVIIHLPEHDAVVNNHLWPALFNIYTLRGEAYRDPLGLIDGLDRIRGMDPEHLVGAHGPPISGRARVREALADYRDSIQFLWDQTVRGINAGLPVEEIVARVRLPRHLAESPWVQPHYGEAAFHVRAIHAGVLGWFDMDTSRLHPLPPAEEARRMLAGFGGAQAMHRQAATAADAGDWSWAIQLATYLMRADPEDASARALKARALRGLAQTTPAANTRSVCLTEARTLEGGPDPMATTSWRANRFQIMNASPARFVRAMRVQLDPDRAAQADVALQVRFTDREASCALHIKGGVARFIDGPLDGAALNLETTLAAWADIYTGRRSLAQACADGEARALPGTAAVAAFFEYFDHLRVA